MLTAILMCYNELKTGNLIRCLESLVRYCDEIVIYDDASTDGSQDIYGKYTSHIIYGEKNDFKNELSHKQQQLEYCKKLKTDWILRIDADEIMDERAINGGLKEMMRETKAPSFAFHTINLWRSPCFYRLDNSFNSVVFNRLWRCTSDLKFEIKEGLHLTNYPIGMTEEEEFSPFEILHYGFASDEAILDKYKMYKSHGQSGEALNRLIDERGLRVAKSKQLWFEKGLPNDKFEEVFSYPLVSKI